MTRAFLCKILWLIPVALACQPLRSQAAKVSSPMDYTSMSFEQLAREETRLHESRDTVLLREVLNWHIQKAGRKQDTLELIQTYRWWSWTEGYQTSLSILDSALLINRDFSKRPVFEADLHYRKGTRHYRADRPVECFKSLLVALEQSKLARQESLYVKCLNLIAVLKMEYGQAHEALELQQSSISYLHSKQKQVSEFPLLYMGALDGLAIGYLHTGKYDSARVVAKRGMDYSRARENTFYQQSFRLLLAQINYYDGNLIKARDSLQVLVRGYTGSARADILYYLGMISGKLGKPHRKLQYFRQIDTILSRNDLPYLDSAEEVYEYLLKDAVAKNERRGQERYLEKSRFIDSLVQIRELQVQSLSHARFDRQMYQLIYPHGSRVTDNSAIWPISLLAFAILIAYGIVRARQAGKMVRQLGKAEKSKSQSGLELRIEQKILDALHEWERDKGFLSPEVSLSSLAKKLHTNSAYLSKVINTHKEVTFANYVKDLRIKYAIDFIHRNREAASRMSTIQLAEQFGFKSQDVFVRSLKSRTGMTPSKYLKQIG